MITDKTKWNDADYYEENFEDIMYDKITEGIDLTEDELEDLIFDYQIEEFEGDRGRWVVGTQSIIRLRDKYFAIDWFKGLTEYQENEIDDQPYEVKKVEKMVPVTEWIPVKQDS